MRDILNAILAFIGESSLTDDEFEAIDLSDDPSDEDKFLGLKAVLVIRQAGSSVISRLIYYFKAKGMAFGDEATAEATNSNVFVGANLCD